MFTIPLLAFSVLAAPQSSDWPQYFGSNGDRTSEEMIFLDGWTESGPRRVWEAPTAPGFSSFAIADGRVFTLVGRELGGSRREACLALDAETGEELWVTAVSLDVPDYDRGGDAGASGNQGGDGPRSTPTYDGGSVYTLDSMLVLSSIDAKTGETRWRRDIVDEFGGRNLRWQNAASPLIEGDLLFVAGGGASESLLAVHKETGKLVWATGDERMTHATPIAATIHDTRQVIFFVQSGLVAVVPETGDVLWTAEYPYSVSTAASPIVHEDMVYVSAGYGVGGGTFEVTREDDTFSAELLWQQRNKLMNHWSTPVCRDGYLYGMFSFKKYGEGPLACVDMATGETKWSTDGFGPGNCIAVGSHLVALADDGQVVIVEATPESYRELARADLLDGKCWSMPAFANGQLYVRSTEEGARFDLSARAER